MGKIREILDGIKNSVFVKEEVEKIANERYAICKGCDKISTAPDDELKGKNYNKLRPDEHCTICACNIHAKVRSLKTKCPIDKWGPEATQEEEVELFKLLQNDKQDESK